MIPIDVIDSVTLISNFCIAVSLPFLIYQLWLQRKELKYSMYEKLMSDFSNLTLSLVEHPRLRELYASGSRPMNWDKYDEDEKALYFYFDSLLGLLERVWISYKEMKLLKTKDWEQWGNWIKELFKNEIFIDIFNESKKLYDPLFIDEMQKILKLSQGNSR
ncbi:MAG: hypothetical protein QXP45_02145 [Thermoproteota archaeon]